MILPAKPDLTLCASSKFKLSIYNLITNLQDKDKCFIINRAPTDTCVYNDNKDFRAIITDVYICKIYTTIKQGYI